MSEIPTVNPPSQPLSVLADEPWIAELVQKYSLGLRESAPREPEFKATIDNFKKLLLDLQKMGYIHLADLTAYDEHPASPRFFAVYELISMKDKRRASVIVPLDDGAPKIDTVTDIWGGANWLERETYDMFGIHFEGHPDLRRILLPPSFKGYPLRKEFVMDYRQDYAKTVAQEEPFDPFGSNIVRPAKQPADKGEKA